jgi:anti-sigma regulatory factor (Ser/Thr protein kinase)
MESDKPGVQVELVAAPEAARQARALVDRVAAGMPGDVGFRARVAVGELVANSVEHAGTAFDRVGLSVFRSGTVIRGEVRDRGAPFDDAPRVVPGRATSGSGLRLVDALVDRWGVEHENGNLVWFEIDEPREGDDDPRSTPPPDAEHDYARIEVSLVAGDDVVSLATFPVSVLGASPQERAARFRA